MGTEERNGEVQNVEPAGFTGMQYVGPKWRELFASRHVVTIQRTGEIK
jgi:hypothetical protein